ncbi:asparagine synthase (glutamine-hydrolyzing) [Candidatus Woesearchaeota archaeon]|nr:asparagine synthase (glutamine-hydrolyzing) [Candidatus Woesearchaeota archaeon]
MCGINGFNWKDEKLITEMNKRIKHRGPDDNGSLATENLSLGQVRLSILDLSSAGHQPMLYSKMTGACSRTHKPHLMKKAELAIVFNGEIYNFQEIREELKRKGYCFSTRCDTEVILASYLEWGPDCVKRFNGMWAFALHDRKKDILFCSRDRIGKKPFFYHFDAKSGKFMFTSELKAIFQQLELGKKEEIDRRALDIYFTTGYIPAPMSIFRNVRKLEARQSLVFDLRKKRIRDMHYHYALPQYKPVKDEKALIREGKSLLHDATRLRMIADVPVGAFLSGGLDSSAVVAAMAGSTELKKLHTFSVGFEDRFDESRYMKDVKDFLRTRHHHSYYKEQDFDRIMVLNRLSYVYDEPFGDYSNFPTYELSRLAREHVTVALSGDGGDEIFGGYTFHQIASQIRLLQKIPRWIRRMMLALLPKSDNPDALMTLKGKAREAFRISLLRPEDFYAEVGSEQVYKPAAFKNWSRERMRRVLRSCGGELEEAVIRYDLYYHTLPDNFLVKTDRASMAHALEVRSPFLDHRFLELEARIPIKWKTTARRRKLLLRKIIKGTVPGSIVRRGKQGFTPPLEKWINKEKNMKVLREGMKRLEKEGILGQEWTQFFRAKVLSGKGHDNIVLNLYRIRLLLLIKWCERWLWKGGDKI